MQESHIFGVILAGGVGSRMGNAEKPKQFLNLGGRPIIIHTIEKFTVNPLFERIIVLSPKQWVRYTKDLIHKFLPLYQNIDVIEGGGTRNETIMNAIDYIENIGKLDEQTIIVTHDAVRPFVTHRILQDNIASAKKYGACDTVVSATDTIVYSENGHTISDIPNRASVYQGQPPQSFQAKYLRDVYESLTEDEKLLLTDACKILTLKQLPVHLVNGEVYNFKITYPHDLRLAQAMLKEEEL